MGKAKVPRKRRSSPAARWSDRGRFLAVAIELLVEGSRLLRDLIGGRP